MAAFSCLSWEKKDPFSQEMKYHLPLSGLTTSI
jgi:hypothetical protein